MKNICKKILAVALIASYVIPKPLDVMAVSTNNQLNNNNTYTVSETSKKPNKSKKLVWSLGIGLGSFLAIITGTNIIFRKYNSHNLTGNSRKSTDVSLQVSDCENPESKDTDNGDDSTESTVDFKKVSTSLEQSTENMEGTPLGEDTQSKDNGDDSTESMVDFKKVSTSLEQGTENMEGTPLGEDTQSKDNEDDSTESTVDLSQALPVSKPNTVPKTWFNKNGKTLGEGSQGSVEKVHWNKQYYARKTIVRIESYQTGAILSEHLAYMTLHDQHHDNIVKPYKFYAIDENGNQVVEDMKSAYKAYVLYEYIDMPTVFCGIRLTGKGFCKAALQLLGAWKWLNERGLKHGDLISQNFAVLGNADNPQIKIFDYGFLHKKKGEYDEYDLEAMKCAGTDLANLVVGILEVAAFRCLGHSITEACEPNNILLRINDPSFDATDAQICEKLFKNEVYLSYYRRTSPEYRWLLKINDKFSEDIVSRLEKYFMDLSRTYEDTD